MTGTVVDRETAVAAVAEAVLAVLPAGEALVVGPVGGKVEKTYSFRVVLVPVEA